MLPDGESIFGPILVNNPWVGWPIHLLVIYVEVVAILIIFRPELHRVWGVMLVLFHVGTFLPSRPPAAALLGIPFSRHMIVLALLFLLSPFAPRFELGRALAVVPGIDWLIALRGLFRGNATVRDVGP